MAKIEIVAATQEYIDALKPRLRATDARECEAVNQTAAQALQWSFDNSSEKMRWVILSDSDPILAFGCAKLHSETSGGVWILGTDKIVDAKTELKMLHGFYTGYMLKTFERLESVVACDNAKAIRYAIRCGFEIELEPTDLNGVNFYKIVKKRGV